MQWVVVVLAMMGVVGAGAQNNKPTAVPTHPAAAAPPALKLQTTTRKLPVLPRPITLADFAGMHPHEDLAASLMHIDNFVQTSPTDGAAPTQQTEVYAGQTATALYFVFICHDTDPGALRAHMARRENILTDDYVGVLLDPFGDRRRGTFFATNAMGVQADAAWDDNNGTDYSYDQVWDSSGVRTAGGWMAEMVIPFRSLRYRTGQTGSDWGIVFRRTMPRLSETDFWPHISQSISGTLSQEATVTGVEGARGSHNYQINPYALAQNEHTLNSLDPNNPYFSSRRLEGTVGGDAKAIVHDSIVIDATVNPDFSQVESDQPQFTVNQRYPVFFPELRPFFLENASYFTTLIDLVYTRNIVHPEFGGRVTGKLGHTNLGALVIDDREPGELYSPGNPNYGKKAIFGVGRVSQDIGKGSNVGLLYTDEEFQGSFSRVGGADFLARFTDKWQLAGQMVESATRSLDGSYAAGPGTKLDLSRSDRVFSFDNTYRDYATGFGSTVGFISYTDIRRDDLNLNYSWFPKHSRVQQIVLESQENAAWDHQGNRVQHGAQADLAFVGARKLIFAPLAVFNSDTLGPQNGYAVDHNLNFAENSFGGVIKGAPLAQLNYNIVYLQGGNVNYNPAAGQPPSLLHENYLQALLTLQPVSQLTVDNTYLLDRDHEEHGGADVYEAQTLRTKINYQFTRALSARVIVEYDSTLVNPATTSLVRTKQVATQALLTWLPHPGTAIYVGYNNDVQNLDRTLCDRTSGNQCNPAQPVLGRSSNYLQDGRQFFVKASYLWRF